MINPSNLGLEVLGTSRVDTFQSDLFKEINNCLNILSNDVELFNKLSTIIVARTKFGCEHLLDKYSVEDLEQEKKSLWKKIIDTIVELWRKFINWITGVKNNTAKALTPLQNLLNTVNKSVKYNPPKQTFKLHINPRAGSTVVPLINIYLDDNQLPFVDVPENYLTDWYDLIDPFKSMRDIELTWDEDVPEGNLKTYITCLMESRRVCADHLGVISKKIDNAIRGINRNSIQMKDFDNQLNDAVNTTKEVLNRIQTFMGIMDLCEEHILKNIKLEKIG